MSISSETNPVDTVRLILDDSGNTWSNYGSEPDHIERAEATTPSVKENRHENGRTAVYVWSPDVGTIDPFAASSSEYEDTEIVQCDIWAANSTDVNDILSDLVSLLFDYHNDNEQSSQWVTIQPVNPSDETAQAYYTGAHSGSSLQVRLVGARTP